VLDYERATHLVRKRRHGRSPCATAGTSWSTRGERARSRRRSAPRSTPRRVRRPPRPRKEDLPGGGARHLRADARGRAVHIATTSRSSRRSSATAADAAASCSPHQPVQDVRRGRDLLLRGGVRPREVQRLRAVREAVPVSAIRIEGKEKGRRRPWPRGVLGAGLQAGLQPRGARHVPRKERVVVPEKAWHRGW